MADDYAEANKQKYDSEALLMSTERRRSAFKKSYAKVAGLLSLTLSDKVVDLGCGTGNLGAALVGRIESYVGYDISEVAIKIANERKIPNSKFLCCDLLDHTDAIGEVDTLISISCVDQMKHKREFMTKLRSMMTEKNKFYIEVRNRGYFFKRYLRRIVPILERMGFVDPMQTSELVDLTHEEWLILFERTGFNVVSVHTSVRPFYFETPKDFLKINLHHICRLLPFKYHYMVGYELRVNNEKQ